METLECYEKWTWRRWHILHTESKTEDFKRVIFIMKVLLWNWLKWRGKSVRKKSCGYFSYPLDPGQSLWPADIVEETWGKTEASLFVIIKKKRIGSYLLPTWL